MTNAEKWTNVDVDPGLEILGLMPPCCGLLLLGVQLHCHYDDASAGGDGQVKSSSGATRPRGDHPLTSRLLSNEIILLKILTF